MMGYASNDAYMFTATLTNNTAKYLESYNILRLRE